MTARRAPNPRPGRTLIAEQTLVAPSATLVLAAIPATYRHLALTLVGRTTRAATSESVFLDFNGDVASANYDHQQLTGAGATAAASETLGAAGTGARVIGALAGASAAANLPGSIAVDVLDYLGAYYKTALGRSFVWATRATGGLTVRSDVVGWANVAPITSCTLRNLNGNNFDTGTRLCLYGIA